MKSKQILKILAICSCLLLIGYIVISCSRMKPQYPILRKAEAKCENIASFLKEYYAQADTLSKQPQVSDAVKFIESQRTIRSLGLSSQAPVPPYLSPFDFGVYLLLPDKLESDSPTLIAYTTRIKKWKPELYFRVGLFLRGTDITAVVLPCHSMEKIVGKGRLEQADPDLHYWACKAQYTKDLNRPPEEKPR